MSDSNSCFLQHTFIFYQLFIKHEHSNEIKNSLYRYLYVKAQYHAPK